MINIKNKDYWNIVKGIGILCIVTGHSCYFLVPFVYLFHLAIFFFVSGYLYNEEKYGDDPFQYFTSKLKSNWIKYISFSIFFTLIHNFLFRHGLIIYTNKYFVADTVTSIINSLYFFGTETMGGALWFVPVFVFASVIFGAIIYFSRKISRLVKRKNILLKNTLIIVATIFVGAVGLYLNNKDIYTTLHSQTSFLVVPFFTAGYYLRILSEDMSKVLKIYIFIPIFIILYYMAYRYIFSVDLATNKIGSIYLFYVVSFLGIYFCLYISKVIYNIKYIKYFNIFGKYSFEIMACHFLVFKIIDYIYAYFNGINDSLIYGMFPYAFRNLWYIYILLGLTIPTSLFYLLDKVKFKFLKR